MRYWFRSANARRRKSGVEHNNMRNSLPGKEAPEPKPPRPEELLRIIEEYTNGLREIIKKLRRHFN